MFQLLILLVLVVNRYSVESRVISKYSSDIIIVRA